MTINLENAAVWMGAAPPKLSGTVSGWSIDSRAVQRREVFFALRGPNHDAHDYVTDALKLPAFCVVDRDCWPDHWHALLVDDTARALQRLARQARRNWSGQVIAVTGSAGKTTTKDVIAHLLQTRIPVDKTVGNFNNHIGLPLSILRLSDACRVAVLEVGMNHAGEIQELATIAEPNVAVITNVGYAHIEFFKDIHGIALAKRELVEALPPGGVAVLNSDDPRVAEFARVHRGRCVTYGFSGDADFRGSHLESADNTSFDCNGVSFTTPLAGRHGAMNVLAGIATASLFGLEPTELVDAARHIPIGKMRGERTEHNGITILNDSYNANPEAMRAMLDVLADTPARRHIAVLGEMLELGEQSDALHRSVGAHAAEKKIDLLIGVRGSARVMLDEATLAGLPSAATLFCDNPVDAGKALQSFLQPGDAVLLKGSRGVRVEQALQTFLETAA